MSTTAMHLFHLAVLIVIAVAYTLILTRILPKNQWKEVLKMNNSLFVIERARTEDAAALLDYLKIVGGETENLSFGAEGVPLDLEAEKDYLRSQCESADNVQYLAKMDGEIIGTASLNRKPRRMSHRGEFGISLKKAWWGCGAASELTEAILAFAKENGFEQLNLEVRSSNARAIRLYEKHGFRKLCTFPRFFKINGEYIDFDLMNLELNTADDHIGKKRISLCHSNPFADACCALPSAKFFNRS